MTSELTIIILLGLLLYAARANAGRWPTPPPWWLRQAACIHHYETYGSTSVTAWHDRRNPVSRGGMQFLRGTWASVGGHGDPADASRGEQLYRAFLVWSRDGGSWREWSTSKVCGLR